MPSTPISTAMRDCRTREAVHDVARVLAVLSETLRVEATTPAATSAGPATVTESNQRRARRMVRAPTRIVVGPMVHCDRGVARLGDRLWGRAAALHDRHAVTPRCICEACTTLVPVTGAAIVEMIDANRGQTVCATDDVSEALATLQFTLVKGPCVQAMTTGRPVLVSDLHEVGHPHWPMFAEAASRTPARAHFSFPLQIGVISMGVLDLYRDQPGPLSTAELAGALLCANVAFWALLELRTGTDADRALGISAESALASLRAFDIPPVRSAEPALFERR